MLDIKSQTQLADATAEMMRACAVATARAASTSLFQGMSFWSRMLQSSAARPTSDFPAAWAAWSTACMPVASMSAAEAPQQAPSETPADSAFASYRSSGGHAVAQVIVA